jgi:hypothetical protein
VATYATGVSFVFNSATFTVTSLTWTLGNTGGSDLIDASHLGLTTGANVISLPRPLLGSQGGDTGRSVSIEYLGTAPISQNQSGTLIISGPIGLTELATCNSSSVTLTVNDIIRGSAEFQLGGSLPDE